MSKPFLPSWMDDAGLTPVQFRILAHLWRRADASGACWPSGPSIAAACKINRDSVWPAIAILESRGFIERSKGVRNSNRYQLRVGGNQGVTQQDESAEKEGLQSAESEGWHPAEKRGRQSAEKEGCKGNPQKGTQRRDSTEGGDSLPEEAAFWNTFEILPKVKSFGPARRKTLAARRKEPSWHTNWKEAIERLSRSSFATGTNDRGWKADIDFLLNPNSFAKIIEGKYDDRKAPPQPATLNIGRRGHANGYNESCHLE